MLWSKLKADFKSNPVARLTWGVEPRSKQRRNRSFVKLCVPSTVYLLLVVGLYLFVVRFSEPLWSDSLLFALVYGGMSSILFLPAIGLFVHSPIAYRRSTRDEYSLAGLSQAQIVLGLNSPYLLGVLIVICLHLLVSMVALLINIISSIPYAPFSQIAFDFFVFHSFAAVSILFGLGSATLLGLARIPFTSRRLHIAAAIYVVGFVSSPFLLVMANPFHLNYAFSILSTIDLFLPNFLIQTSLSIVLWSEAISWLPRGFIVWRAWRRLLNDG